MTKDTIDLMAAVQRAYDRVLHTQDKAARIFDFSEEETFYMKLDEAYDAYDALVDSLVESTGGNASAVNTDPLTFYDIKHKDKNMTYNEMAEVVGQAAFGGYRNSDIIRYENRDIQSSSLRIQSRLQRLLHR